MNLEGELFEHGDMDQNNVTQTEPHAPMLVSLIVTVSTSCAIAAWFNYLQSHTTYLPQLLFYTRLTFDLLGGPAKLIHCCQLHSSFVVSMLAISGGLIFVPLFFMSAIEEGLLAHGFEYHRRVVCNPGGRFEFMLG